MAFVASASAPWEENSSNFIDSFGSQCLSVFRSIGLPSTTVLIRVSSFCSILVATRFLIS